MILVLFLSLISITGSDISLSNRLKKEIGEALEAKQYEVAEKKLYYLKDSMKIKSPEVFYNLATAFYQKGDKILALAYYDSVSGYQDKKMTSRAEQQIGSILFEENKFQASLQAFKKSILNDPLNKDSRYNYELVKKKIAQPEQQQQNNESPPPDSKDEPSEFAKSLKKQADELVDRKEYEKAHTIMIEGMKYDETVEKFYGDFTKRLGEVSEIAKT